VFVQPFSVLVQQLILKQLAVFVERLVVAVFQQLVLRFVFEQLAFFQQRQLAFLQQLALRVE